MKNHTWITIAEKNIILVIERISDRYWLINGKLCQTTGIIYNHYYTQCNLDLGLGKELVIFYYESEEEIGNVFYYDMCISNNEPLLTFKQPFLNYEY